VQRERERERERERRAGSSASCITSPGVERVFRVTFVRARRGLALAKRQLAGVAANLESREETGNGEKIGD
jgi:hypothetical protein